MNLKEQLAAKKAELAAFEDGIKSGDEEAIKSASELMDEIESIEAAIEEAEAKAAVLEEIKSDNPIESKETSEMEYKSLIDQAAEVVRGDIFSIGTEVKANANEATVTTPTLVDYDKRLTGVGSHTAIADFCGSLAVQGNSITYWLDGAWNGDFADTAEDGKAPQMSTSYEPKTVSLAKVAGMIKESDEILSDADFMVSAINNKLMRKLAVKEDVRVMNSIKSTTGLGEGTADFTSATSIADAIFQAITDIETDTPYKADVVFISPADYQLIATSKDENGQYYAGGFFQGAYGNGSGSTSSIWGIPVHKTNTLSSGEVIVAAGKDAITVAKKDVKGINVYNQNDKDAEYGRVTLIASERLAAYVNEPKGVVVIEADENL